MKTIYKYPVEIIDNQFVKMPMNSEILDVQFQGNQLCLWALVESQNPLTDYRITIYETGHETQWTNLSYIGTVQKDELVWHIFENFVK